MTEETLRALEDLRLLRREDRAGVARVELTRDVLAPLMLKGRELGRRREERERREAQIRAEVEAAERDKRTELERRGELERVRTANVTRRLKWEQASRLLP